MHEPTRAPEGDGAVAGSVLVNAAGVGLLVVGIFMGMVAEYGGHVTAGATTALPWTSAALLCFALAAYPAHRAAGMWRGVLGSVVEAVLVGGVILGSLALTAALEIDPAVALVAWVVLGTGAATFARRRLRRWLT